VGTGFHAPNLPFGAVPRIGSIGWEAVFSDPLGEWRQCINSCRLAATRLLACSQE
jgi:hypothetical protein